MKNEMELIKNDLRLKGVAFTVDGARVSPERVIVHQAARQQAAVVLPPSPYMPDTEPGSMTEYEQGEAQGRCDMWAEVKRLNAAAPQAEQEVTEEDKQALLDKLVYVGEQVVEPLDQRMVDHFTCTRVDDAGGTPGFTLYMTKMGGGHTHQLYRNEAAALHYNLGRALGLTAPPTPDVSGLVEALEDIAGKHHHSASAGSYFAEVARAALAAHKQEGK